MRRSPGRYGRVVSRLVSAELRQRRAAGQHSATLPRETPAPGGPVVAALPEKTSGAKQIRESASSQPNLVKQQEVEMPSKSSNMNGARGPARSRGQRTSISFEEGSSLAAWSTLLALVVIAFFTWSPPRPGRRGYEAMAKVVLPAPDDPALLGVEALAREPLARIVEVADSRDAAARGRMIAALVRRSAARELVGLVSHPTDGVRGAIPLALSSLGLVPPEQVGEYTARLLSSVEDVRHQAARDLAVQVGRQREEIARGL
jgi:hypothetical protein